MENNNVTDSNNAVGKGNKDTTIKGRNPEKKAIRIIASILSVMLLLVAIVCTVMVFTSKATGYPKLFGYSLFSVQSDSMEPTIKKGDLIVCKAATEEMTLSCKVGEIITFTMQEPVTKQTIINTHRIIAVDDSSPSGYVYYTTQGDKNATISKENVEEVSSVFVIGKYTDIRLGGIGSVMDFLKKPLGFGLCVLLPIAVFFLYYLIDFIKKFTAYKAEVVAEQAKLSGLTEDDKRRIAEEYLASQSKGNDTNTTDGDSGDTDSAECTSDDTTDSGE